MFRVKRCIDSVKASALSHPHLYSVVEGEQIWTIRYSSPYFITSTVSSCIKFRFALEHHVLFSLQSMQAVSLLPVLRKLYPFTMITNYGNI